VPSPFESCMRAYYCDHFVLPLPDGHRFSMEKYRMLRERMVDEDLVDLAVPDAATREDLGRVHGGRYVDGVFHGALTRDEIGRMGFPWPPVRAGYAYTVTDTDTVDVHEQTVRAAAARKTTRRTV
jgi:acetoin utilization deacetylase AcuC-like enzyme